jgi:hypothetical protein
MPKLTASVSPIKGCGEEEQLVPGLVSPHAVIHLNGKTFIVASSEQKGQPITQNNLQTIEKTVCVRLPANARLQVSFGSSQRQPERVSHLAAPKTLEQKQQSLVQGDMPLKVALVEGFMSVRRI